MKLSSRKELLVLADDELKRLRKLAGITESKTGINEELNVADGEFGALMKKVPARFRKRQWIYVGNILIRRSNNVVLTEPQKRQPGAGSLKNVFVNLSTDRFYDFVVRGFRGNEDKAEQYAQSLYMKPGNTKDIFTNMRGKEELELVYM